MDEEILRRLYVTYRVRRKQEKSRTSQKIKQLRTHYITQLSVFSSESNVNKVG